MNDFEEIIEKLKVYWNYELFHMGDSPFTTKKLLLLLVSLFLLFFITSKVKKLLIKKVFPRYDVNVGVGQSIATIVSYVVIIIGLVVIFQTTGVDLSALGILIGALGIGIGFGLQNITNNFISGIIILFERPVKVGDRIEIDDLTGNIINISGRATTIVTNDNIVVIVPNSDLTSKRVINWSHNNREVRLNFPVGVSYKEDPEMIQKLLIEIAMGNPGVLKDPRPEVLFENFGESSLDFILRVWTSDFSDTPKILQSQLYYAIFKKFKEQHIEIPFPQRDLHLKSGFEKVNDAL